MVIAGQKKMYLNNEIGRAAGILPTFDTMIEKQGVPDKNNRFPDLF